MAELRDPTRSEIDFFHTNPNVAGYAAPDNRVVLNPFSTLSDMAKQAVIRNESSRILMRTGKLKPSFDLTQEQFLKFGQYGSLQDMRETIAARLISGDPSAGTPTKAQLDFVKRLKGVLGN